MIGFTTQLETLLADGELAVAIERVIDYLKGSAPQLLNEAILQSSRLARVKREQSLGIISDDDARRELARITAGVLDFVQQLPRRLALYAPEHAPLPLPSSPSAVLPAPTNAPGEKVLDHRRLKNIEWLQQGSLAARSVCRIVTHGSLGSGFLIGGGLVVSNNHVLFDEVVFRAVAEFGFEEDAHGKAKAPVRYRLDPDSLRTDLALDVSVMRVMEEAGKPPIEEWGALSFESARVPAIDDHVNIIQHPEGGPKKIAVGANQVVNVFEYRLQYLTETMRGSSGAPVFNDEWRVVAMHCAGGNMLANTAGDRRFVNEGILSAYVLGVIGADAHPA
jgi:V8-like Glu-specific endopeptidase